MSWNSEMNCPACGKSFNCKATDGAACWCTELPAVLPVNADSQCFCPDCLASQIAGRFKAEPEKAAPYLSKPSREVITRTMALEEGRDYYINYEGNWVFTTFYHLKKGYCCQNGCKHCPYGFKKR